jgi:glycerol-3-phosphate dehydrogenase (NAD(P)+)
MPEKSSYIVVGDGQMGLVLASLLHEVHPDARVVLWGHVPSEIKELRATRRSPRLADYELPEAIEVVTDIGPCVDASLACVVSAVPTQFVRGVWETMRGVLPPSVPIVSVSKGVEIGTGLFPTSILAQSLDEAAGTREYVTLSGPTIATELAARKPATMLAACIDVATAQRVQQMFSSSWMRVYTTTDHAGVELAGAAKNVIALAAGIVDGMDLGFNAKSSLLSRGLAEVVRLGEALGARAETFFGIAGVGDLATTCFCPQGRNRSCGEALGRGQSLDDFLEHTIWVVEGVPTTRALLVLAREHNVEMPITEAVASVLFEGVSPGEAIATLMGRPLRSEVI